MRDRIKSVGIKYEIQKEKEREREKIFPCLKLKIKHSAFLKNDKTIKKRIS